MPSVSSRPLVFSVPRLVIYVFVGILLVSWAMVGFGGYWGISLYQAYLQLKEENGQLTQREMELEALRLTMKRIQRNEKIVHDALIQERKLMMEGGLGQGGMPATKPSRMMSEDVPASGSMVPPAQYEHASILDQARGLQENLEELLEIIRERRESLNSTPSILPLKAQSYRITSRFGWRRSPFTGLKEFHDGLDIGAPLGTPIVAPGEGRVRKVGHDRHLGRYLQIDHGRRCITTYAHLSGFNVTLGQKVKRGEVIAYMGNSGRSTGSHLHYEVEIKGKPVNPNHYILNPSVKY
jgi:murein DD-endopeptidase MepM/ murein hydrolase activator NlpD